MTGQALSNRGAALPCSGNMESKEQSNFDTTMLLIPSLTFCFRWEIGRRVFANGPVPSYRSCPEREIWAEEQFTLSSHVHKTVNWAFEVAMATLFAYEIKWVSAGRAK